MDPFTLKIGKSLEEKIDRAIIERVDKVVFACKTRDEELFDLHLILEGISQPAGSDPWPNACSVESTLAREFHTTLHAACSSAVKQFPYCSTEAVKSEDEDEASEYETYINLKAQRGGYEEAIDDTIYTALESKFSPLKIIYDQEIAYSFEAVYQDPQGNLIPEEMLDPAQDYVEVLTRNEEVISDGITFQPVLPWDWYTDPIDAIGCQVRHGCERVIERIPMTRERLLLGVRDLGYDDAQVKSLLKLGPTGTNSDAKKERDEDAGKETASEDYWECFQVVGRIPAILDEQMNDEVPMRLRYMDFLFMVCPQHNIVFKRAFSPFPGGLRPYALYRAFIKPGSAEGHGIVDFLRDLQQEHTALTRFGINTLNLETTPMMSVPERWLTKYAKWKTAPGRFLPRVTDSPNEITPIQWNMHGQTMILNWMDRLDAYAGRLAAAQSVNSALAGKVRKATEIQFADAMMQTKFDLVQSNINRGIKETFEIVAALCSQHSKQEETLVYNGQPITLTADQIRKSFRFIPQANAEGANSSLRLQKDMVVAQIARQSAVFNMRLQMGDLVPDWVLTHRLLTHAGWRNPEELIGPDPRQDMQAQMMYQQMAMANQALPPTATTAPGGEPPPEPGMNGSGGMEQGYDLASLGQEFGGEGGY